MGGFLQPMIGFNTTSSMKGVPPKNRDVRVYISAYVLACVWCMCFMSYFFINTWVVFCIPVVFLVFVFGLLDVV